MAGKYNIVTKKSDTFTLNFTIATDGVAWDLTTYTAKFHVKQSSASASPILALSTDAGITMNSSGEVSITATSSEMDLPTGRWVYDFELTSAGNVKTTLLEGRFIVEPEVSV
jgi:hypothetical protein